MFVGLEGEPAISNSDLIAIQSVGSREPATVPKYQFATEGEPASAEMIVEEHNNRSLPSGQATVVVHQQ